LKFYIVVAVGLEIGMLEQEFKEEFIYNQAVGYLAEVLFALVWLMLAGMNHAQIQPL